MEVANLLRDDMKSTIDVLRESIAENRESLTKKHVKTSTDLNEHQGLIITEISKNDLKSKKDELPRLEPLTN